MLHEYLLGFLFLKCVVAEDIHTSRMEGNGNSWGEGGGYREEKKAEEADKQVNLAQMHEDIKMKRFDRLLTVLEKM